MSESGEPDATWEPRPVRLLVEERRRRIMEILDQQERVTVEELVRRFGVSAVTIRGDLDALAEDGALVRSHGGALRHADSPEDVPIALKQTRRHAEKVRIARAAVETAGLPERVRAEDVDLDGFRALARALAPVTG